jgi:DNA-directed RNA polymerase specialized sigma24 family protein
MDIVGRTAARSAARRPVPQIIAPAGPAHASAEDGVTALYHAHALGLIRLAHIMLGDRTAAEDVVQDAFCGLYRNWTRLADQAKALPYVRSSVLNGCRSALRRRCPAAWPACSRSPSSRHLAERDNEVPYPRRRDQEMNQTGRPEIGLLHPGEMGAAVGKCLTGRGHTVVWASAGRSEQTRARAEAAGLTDEQTIPGAYGTGLLISICPPQAAEDVALACRDMDGIYVDANAVSPATAERIRWIVEETGGAWHGGHNDYVDGAIIGPPPVQPGTTRLYLSGPPAAEVAALFEGSPLEARVLDGPLTAASALKMAYAGWTKGSAALLVAMRDAARALGVQDDLLAEWALSQPGLAAQADRSAQAAAAKGWRWETEMLEIAATLAAAGLPAGFHQAAAEVFSRHERPAHSGG